MTREEAINVMQKYTDTESGISKVVAEAHKMAIKALGQEPKTEWISVSERLPDEQGRYLVTTDYRTYYIVETANYTNNLYKIDKHDFLDKKCAGWYDFDSEYGYYEVERVVAWQPLPKPYSEAEQ